MSLDRSVFTATSGLKQVMDSMSVAANNLANVSTIGFKAQVESFTSVPVNGDGLNTRTMVINSTSSTDFKPGPINQTGNPLDIAIENDGFIAVQASDGKEAYTRNGSLQLDSIGNLTTTSGQKVLGDGGPISIPPDSEITIGKDGTISTSQKGNASTQVVGRIKLVNPDVKKLERGDDGLFRLKSGTASASASVKIQSGALEGSNVNPVESMIKQISLARSFEMHTKLLTSMDAQAQKADSILALS